MEIDDRISREYFSLTSSGLKPKAQIFCGVLGRQGSDLASKCQTRLKCAIMAQLRAIGELW